MTNTLGHGWAGHTFEHVQTRTTLLHVNQTLCRHDDIWQLLTIYSNDSCRCNIMICTVTTNNDEKITKACLGRYPPPLGMSGQVPPLLGHV